MVQDKDTWGDLRSTLQKTPRALTQDRGGSLSYHASSDTFRSQYKEHVLADIVTSFEKPKDALTYLMSCEDTYGFDYALVHHLYNTHPANIKLNIELFPWTRFVESGEHPLVHLEKRHHDPDNCLTEDFWYSQGNEIHWAIDSRGSVLLTDTEHYLNHEDSLEGDALLKEQRENIAYLLCTQLRKGHNALWDYERWLRTGGKPGQWGLVPPADIFKITSWEDMQLRSDALLYNMSADLKHLGLIREMSFHPVDPCPVPFKLTQGLRYCPTFDLYKHIKFEIPSLVPNQDLLDYVKACLLSLWMISEQEPHPRCFMHHAPHLRWLTESPDRREHLHELPPLKLTKDQRAVIEGIFERAQNYYSLP